MERVRVGLFVTCLVDLFRPQVGFASVRLLERAGCVVDVPLAQSCCGQPAYNSGDKASAAEVAAGVIAAFSRYDAVVVPSGSCAGMIRTHYPELFADSPDLLAKARALAARTWELTDFLHQRGLVLDPPPAVSGSVTYHDSCSSLRELGVRAQPRALLAQLPGLSVSELAQGEECCGFGGTFCVKYPEISGAMVSAKAADVEATGADTLLAGDLGCLLNIAGLLHRQGSNVKCRHVAEVLAGMDSLPAIGEAG
jgi:L-lactate dehydrogenase complex protein LldE